MAIVKKTKNGKTYYWDTVNKKFAKKPSGAKSKTGSSVGRSLVKGKTGRLTTKACSTAGSELKTRGTSSAGRRLRKCR